MCSLRSGIKTCITFSCGHILEMLSFSDGAGCAAEMYRCDPRSSRSYGKAGVMGAEGCDPLQKASVNQFADAEFVVPRVRTGH